MSAYKEIKTQIKDKDCLLKALEEKGKVFEVHDTPQTLIDYCGKPRPQKAEIIIRRKNVGGAANDIGFAKQADGTYQAIISANEISCGYGEKWQKSLADSYATHKVKKLAKAAGATLANGWTQKETVLPDGTIEVVYTQRAHA